MLRPKESSASVRRMSWRGLIPQFIVIIILPLVLALLAIPLGSLALHQKAMRDLVGERDEHTVRSVARALSEQFYHRATSLRALASRSVDGVSPNDVLVTSDYLLADFDGGLAFYAADGRVLAASGKGLAANQRELLNLPGRTTIPPIFSTPFTDPDTGDEVMLVASPTEADGLVVGAFSLTALFRSTLADAFVVDGQASAYVVDSAFQSIYRTGSLPLAAHGAVHPGIKEALRGESGTAYIQQTSDSGEHVVAFSPIPPVGWALVIEEQWERVASPLLRSTQFAPLVLIPPLLLSLVALWFGVRQIVGPLHILAGRAAELAWGRFEAIEQPVSGIAEIRRLQIELIHMAHKVKAAQENLRDYISAITTGQEEERRRLARELHDDTLQGLIALNQRTQLVRLSLADSPAAARLTEIQILAEQVIANLRRLTRALRPIYLEDLGLVTALDMLARETGQNSQLKVEFHRVGQERRLMPEVELALYRMAQEALSNVVRHAQASRASLSIQFKTGEMDEVVVTVVDDGHGFKTPETPAEFAEGHFGLLGLQERSELIGARLDIQSSPGSGTQVTIRLPTPSTAT